MKKQIVSYFRAIDFGPSVKAEPEQAAEQTLFFIRELMRWNERMNLTAGKDETSIFAQHFADSLEFARALTGPGAIIDIGSGAGFPGIPLKIVFPDLEMTLLESRRKRASFLKSVLRGLQIEPVTVRQDRAEQVASDPACRGRFQYALFRAVAKLGPSLALGAPLIRPGGQLIVKKGLEEETSAEADCKTLGLLRKGDIPLAGQTEALSQLVIFEKCST